MNNAPIFGKYRLLRRLAVGGMAEVFLAEVIGREGFLRRIVIKRILPQFCEDPYFVELFINEAAISAKLAHSNIVQIFDFDRVGGQYYLAMEHVAGSDLASLLRRSARQQLPIPRSLAFYIVAELLEALSYAHCRHDEQGVPLGIVHRDVSPGNVLLSFAGEVKLSDFGIARARSTVNLTQPGVLKGKAPYMSPEQVEGRPIDARSDLFSVGVVLYELCVGRRPFRGGSDLEVMDRIRRLDFVPPRAIAPTLSPSVEAVILKALAWDPEQRFPEAEALLEAIRDVASSEGGELGAHLLVPLLTRLVEGQGAAGRPPLKGPSAAVDLHLPTPMGERGFDALSDGSTPVSGSARSSGEREASAPVRLTEGGWPSPQELVSAPPAAPPTSTDATAAAVGPSAMATSAACPPLEKTERLSHPELTAVAEHSLEPLASGLSVHHAPPELPMGTRWSRIARAVAHVAKTPGLVQAWAVPFGLGVLFAVFLGAGLWLGIRAVTPRVELTVGWRVRDVEERWLRRVVIAPFERAHHARVRILRYERPEDVEDVAGRAGVDLVETDLLAARPLVERGWIQRLEPLARDAGRSKELDERLTSLRPVATAMVRYPSVSEWGVYYLPRKLGVRVLVARRSKVAEAVRRFSGLQPQLEQALVRLTGRGLPPGFTLESEPARWEWFDLVAAAFVWARSGEVTANGDLVPGGSARGVGRVMVRRHRDVETLEDMLDSVQSLSAADGGPGRLHGGSVAFEDLLEFFAWEALFRELELLHPATWRPDTAPRSLDILDGLRSGETYLGVLDASELDGLCAGASDAGTHGAEAGVVVRAGCGDFLVAPMPRAARLWSPPLPAPSGPARSRWPVQWTASLWGVTRASEQGSLALDLLLRLSAPAVSGYFDTFVGLSPRQEIAGAMAPRDPMSRMAVSLLEQLDRADGSRGYQIASRPVSFVELRQRRDRLLDAWRHIVVLRTCRDRDGRLARDELARRIRLYLDD
jgi:serine/threonine protein kinase